MDRIKKYAIKKGITDTGELNKIQDFFNREDIKDNIKYIIIEKIYYGLLLFFGLITEIFIVLFLIFIFLFSSYSTVLEKYILLIIPLLFLFIMSFKRFYDFLYKNIKKSDDNLIIQNFSKIIDSNFDFDRSGKYAFGNIEQLSKKGFLKSFTKINITEDSIHYTYVKDGKRLNLNGFELGTILKTRYEGQHKNEQGIIEKYEYEKEVDSNSCYILKATLPDIRTKIKSDIIIQRNNSRNSKNFILYIGTLAFGYAFPIMIVSKIFNINEDNLKFLGLTTGIMSLMLVRYYLTKYQSKNSVKLENIDFEKKYDVYSEDQIQTRMIITTAFMDRINRLENKNKKHYEFYIKNNSFYIKWNLKKYGSINNSKSINKMDFNLVNIFKKIVRHILEQIIIDFLYKNTVLGSILLKPKKDRKITKYLDTYGNMNIFGLYRPYIDWYVEMKEIISFVQGIQILYLSNIDPEYLQDINVETNNMKNTNIINPTSIINTNSILSI